MTEKRFWYDFEDCTGAKIVDFKENKEYPLETIGDFRKIEKLLNEQHEQIQILKATNGEMEDYLTRLEEENEQLKQYKQAVNDVLDSYYQRDLTPIEEILVGRIAKELNVDLHYKYKGDVE